MMKKLMIIAGGLILASACTKSVSSLTITPDTATVYTDEALPELNVTGEPEDVFSEANVKWTSSDPDIITVDEKGVLTFAVKDIEDAEKVVTISASVDECIAECKITVKGQIARYEVLDFTSEFGIQMLDRNVGAKSKQDAGLYFQFCKNTPVTAQTIDEEWNADASSKDYSDWSKPGNSPCPAGWEPINEAQKNEIAKKTVSIIGDYEMFDDFFGDGEESGYSTAQYKEAKALFARLGLVPGGSIQPGKTGSLVNEQGIYNEKAVYIWTGIANGQNNGISLGYALEYSSTPNFNKSARAVYGYNLRCVKASK